MTYLRGTTLNEQSISGKIALDARQELWAGPLGIAWVLAFARSAAQALSPSAIRQFFSFLFSSDRLLTRFGWALVMAVPAFALAGVFDPGIALSVNPWIKPIKFSISFATYVWTVGLFLTGLRMPNWQRTLLRRTMVGSVVVEMLALGAQAWRATQLTHHPSADWLILQTTTAMVSVNTTILVWLLVKFFGKSKTIQIADAAQVLAIRLSIVIFLVGNAVGGYMLARGSHTVGATDNGPGLPFVNWSTIGGDLRIAHFIAIHAIQIVPVFAWILWRMLPAPGTKQRKLLVCAVAAIVAFAVGGTFLQAMLAHPFLALGR